MPIVDQRTPDRQQAERREMVVGNAAADCGVRNVDENDAHLSYSLIGSWQPTGLIVSEQAILIYYTVQAANRRHFQLMFFAVIGFTWSFALALFAILAPYAVDVALLASGFDPTWWQFHCLAAASA